MCNMHNIHTNYIEKNRKTILSRIYILSVPVPIFITGVKDATSVEGIVLCSERRYERRILIKIDCCMPPHVWKVN
jgi:hypothetical protein